MVWLLLKKLRLNESHMDMDTVEVWKGPSIGAKIFIWKAHTFWIDWPISMIRGRRTHWRERFRTNLTDEGVESKFAPLWCGLKTWFSCFLFFFFYLSTVHSIDWKQLGNCVCVCSWLYVQFDFISLVCILIAYRSAIFIIP